jgi:hypothetical protein
LKRRPAGKFRAKTQALVKKLEAVAAHGNVGQGKANSLLASCASEECWRASRLLRLTEASGCRLIGHQLTAW